MSAARIILFLCILLCSSAAHAQLAVNCPTYNTTEFTTGRAAVLSACTISTGPFDTVYVTAIGETTCGPGSDVSLILVTGTGAGPYPSTGANFNGSITGGVLTITSMVTPYPAFTVATGQTLFDAGSGSGIPNGSATCNGSPCKGSNLTITGPLTGSGGVGTYSVSDNSVTVGAELMWALNIAEPEGKPPNSLLISKGTLEQFNCTNGTSIIMVSATLPAGTFAPNNLNWVSIMLTSESISGGLPKSASWNNGQITMFAPGVPPTTGGIVQ